MEIVTEIQVPGAREATKDLKQRVWERFSKDHAVLFEVPIDGEKNGGYSRQSVDAVAVGLWAKTQHIVHGFELKVTRADLRAELKNPTKHLAALRACDRFWLVVPSRDLYLGTGRQEDLSHLIPEGWGIMIGRDTKYARTLTTVRQAQPLKPDPSRPLDRRFVAGLVQRACTRSGDPSFVELDLTPRRASRRRRRPVRRAA